VIHIRSAEDGGPICGGGAVETDALVDSALNSDCDACRAEVMIGPMSQKGCAFRPLPQWESEPRPDADEIAAFLKRQRDGR
jgi:hypothetical protein